MGIPHLLLLLPATLAAVEPTPVTADLARLVTQAANEPVPPFAGEVYGGGHHVVKRTQLISRSTELAWVDDHLELRMQPLAGLLDPGIDVMAAFIGLDGDWAPYLHLEAEVEAAGGPLTAILEVNAPGRIGTRAQLDDGERATLRLDLFDLPRFAPAFDPLKPMAVRITGDWADTAPRTLIVHSLHLAGDGRDDDRQPRVDRFGQRIAADWPGKVAGEDGLARALAKERAAMAAEGPLADRNRYGGWTDGPVFEATGFFRTHKDEQGRWWLVDPEGRPFWSVGINGVRLRRTDGKGGMATEGREWLFEELPPRNGPFADIWSGDRVSFYGWNVLRKYGSIEGWRDHQVARFRHLGINTIGCWSEPVTWAGQEKVPYTLWLQGVRGVKQPKRLPGHRMPDVWDADYERFLDESLGPVLRAHRDDPWLVGYFYGNEPNHKGLDLPWPEGQKERDAYLARYLEQWWTVLGRVLKRHDPNHLHLGCRWAGGPDKADRKVDVPAMARVMDIISVNIYAFDPKVGSLERWAALAGVDKPILIGEHNIPLDSPKTDQPPFPVFGEEVRRRHIREFYEAYIRSPRCVGLHWYKYNGGAADSLVDVADELTPDLAEGLREVSEGLYRWRMEGAR